MAGETRTALPPRETRPLVYCAACLWRGTPADLVEARPGRLVCPACEEDECREENGTFSRAAAAMLGIGAVARRLARNAGRS